MGFPPGRRLLRRNRGAPLSRLAARTGWSPFATPRIRTACTDSQRRAALTDRRGGGSGSGLALLRSLADDSPSATASFWPGNNLPSRRDVVQLYRSKGTNGMRASVSPTDKQALRGSGTGLIVLDADNGDMSSASSPAAAPTRRRGYGGACCCRRVAAELIQRQSHAHGARVRGQQRMRSLVGR